MQALAQPDTMRSAAVAAVVTGLASYPRLWLWTDRPNALWFMETLLVLTSFVLWTFVFGWYPTRARRSVLQFPLERRIWVSVFVAGVLAAISLTVAVDAKLRVLDPGDYPETFTAWLAGALFSMTFGQLFLSYAPLSLFLRLFGDPRLAILFTVLLGEFLLGLQLSAVTLPIQLPYALLLFGLRAVLGGISAWLFLRGGLLPGTVWALLIEGRLILL